MVIRWKKRTKKMCNIKDVKIKMKALPQDLVGPTAENDCVLFYIWNPESGGGCLLSLTKT